MDIKAGLGSIATHVARDVLGLGDQLKRLRGEMDLTILFTDIDNYTSITERIGDRRAQHLVRVHNGIVRKALAEHSGVEVKHTGDGIMAYFMSASRGVECAVSIQKALEAYRAKNPSSELEIAVGLNTGAPIREDADLYGTAVIVAARVADLADGGEILTTDVVRQLAAGKRLRFEPRGTERLDGMSEAIQLFEVGWDERHPPPPRRRPGRGFSRRRSSQ